MIGLCFSLVTSLFAFFEVIIKLTHQPAKESVGKRHFSVPP